MVVKDKSFFQTTAGVVTGIAGILTAVVGLLTVAAQLGWLSSNDGGSPVKSTDSTTNTTATNGTPTTVGRFGTATTSPYSTSGASGTGSAGAAAPQFTVDPPAVTFENLAPTVQEITISNTGTSAISFQSPTITGADASRFTVSDETCGTRLEAGEACQLKVTFLPRSGTSTATLLIRPSVPPQREVPLKGTSLL